MILVDDKQVQEGTRDKRLKKTYNILRESHISLKWFSCESPILVELDLNMFVLENPNQTRCWWEASALTTAPSLLIPHIELIPKSNPFY